MTDYSDFIILLARQRSGSFALSSVLETHVDIYSFGEVFDEANINVKDEVVRNTSYFNFLASYTQGNPQRAFPNNHETLFLDYLEYLRCFSKKKFKIIHIKYNSTHHITQMWRWLNEEPTLFRYIKKYKLNVLHLTRQNYLRAYISDLKANAKQLYHCIDENQIREVESAVKVDVDVLLARFVIWDEERQIIDKSFKRYQKILKFDYNEMYETLGGELSPCILQRIEDWLKLDNPFTNRVSKIKKGSFLPLEASITNYEDVKKALIGSRFEIFLQDEHVYSRS